MEYVISEMHPSQNTWIVTRPLPTIGVAGAVAGMIEGVGLSQEKEGFTFLDYSDPYTYVALFLAGTLLRKVFREYGFQCFSKGDLDSEEDKSEWLDRFF